ncbi:nucleotide sugar dehydrogenase [Halosegnis rubeus]|uniref:UDP-N-acetyl-D-mannosamine dehydrogenase n=1 Tax=Halosegnis rubeus TaxID=2212850 RepID=A0A5N5U7S4_9EURY|nr:nucleotide sugar dehydrogenase [Halosegnis rubeus]KAB7514663.1 nucleotide sugar dehydrogenase [Halosegnis rubeus]
MSTIYNSETPEHARADAFTGGDVPVAVYGLGKMGLPLAAVYADVCSNVTGVDVDPDVVDAVQAGECPVSGEPGLPALVGETVEEGALRATTDIDAAAADAKIHVAIVPTLVDERNNPDLSILQRLLEKVGPGLDAGDVVFIESTVPPGSCRDELLPVLEATSGLTRGEFGLAFCPERTSSGRAIEDIMQSYPKVVGGIDPASTEAARIVYEQLNQQGVIPVDNATTAETVKITEGVYRDVNIALANELAALADPLPVDFNEVADAANTIPFINVHQPGAGVGGHCIPYYPYFLINWLDTEFPLLQTARDVNDSMPDFTVDALHSQFEAIGRDIGAARVLVLGVAYRGNVAETRAAPAKPILKRLSREAGELFVTDPVIDDLSAFAGTEIELSEIETEQFDAIVLVTHHEEFNSINWDGFDPLVVVNGRPSATIDSTKHRVYTIGSGLQARGEL